MSIPPDITFLLLKNGLTDPRAYPYRWIAGNISEILGNEDDVVIELCFNLLEGSRFVSLETRISTPLKLVAD